MTTETTTTTTTTNHNPNARYFYDEWPRIGYPRFTKRYKEVRFWVAVGPRNGAIVGFHPGDPGVVV